MQAYSLVHPGNSLTGVMPGRGTQYRTQCDRAASEDDRLVEVSVLHRPICHQNTPASKLI